MSDYEDDSGFRWLEWSLMVVAIGIVVTLTAGLYLAVSGQLQPQRPVVHMVQTTNSCVCIDGVVNPRTGDSTWTCICPDGGQQ